jgi:hypothetical protein
LCGGDKESADYVNTRYQGTYVKEDGSILCIYDGCFNIGAFDDFDGCGKLIVYYISNIIKYEYEGEFENGSMKGKGKLTRYYEDGTVSSVYEGFLVDENPCGQGKLINYNKKGDRDSVVKGKFRGENGRGKSVYYNKASSFISRTYTGGITNFGHPNGNGTLFKYCEDGFILSEYSGMFENGTVIKCIKLTEYLENGNTRVYDGEFGGYRLVCVGKFSDEELYLEKGICTVYNENNIIVSKIEIFNTTLDKFYLAIESRQGKLTRYSEDGKVKWIYEGEFNDYGAIIPSDYDTLMPRGQGTLTNYSENGISLTTSGTFDGAFDPDAGIINGTLRVTCYYEDNVAKAMYEGEFKNDALKGKCTLYSEYGSVSTIQEGEFKDFVLNGQGKVTICSEYDSVLSIWEGEYKDGELNGQGKVTTFSEDNSITEVVVGIFRSDALQGNFDECSEDGTIMKVCNANKDAQPIYYRIQIIT